MVPILTGPTATGKSALAVRLAERCGLEIINADATLVYKGMDIGTAKPSPDERARVPHHLIDVIEPNEAISVVRYLDLAEAAIADVLARGRLPLVVGGSGYYIRALSEGLYELPPADPRLEAELSRDLEERGFDMLLAELAAQSPEDAARVGRNPRRLLRALFVLRKTGRPPRDLPRRGPRFRFKKLVLWPERSLLCPRIQARARAQFAAGLVEEVRGLIERYPEIPTALQTIGYKEVLPYLEGRITLEEAIEADWRAVWRYAKRQYTWFRKEPGDVTYLPRMGEAAWTGLWDWFSLHFAAVC